MAPEFSFVALFDLLAFVQGTLLGILLMLKRKDHLSYFLLGLFLFSYSSELIVSVLADSKLFPQRPEFLYLPVSFYFLFMPSLFLYVKSLTEQINWKKYAWLFIPTLAEFGMMLFLFFQPKAEKLQQYNDDVVGNFYALYVDIAMIYSMIFGLVILRQIDKHRKRVASFHSNVQGKQLNWVKWVCIFIILINIVLLFGSQFGYDIYETYIYPGISLINVIFIFWAALSGFKQKIVAFPERNIDHSKVEKKQSIPVSENEVKADKGSTSLEETYQNMLTVIRSEKIFVEPDLHLADLAKKLHLSQRHLSEIINQKAGVNFNQFINKFRIEEAKKILLDEKYAHLNIMGIGYEVGFNSKTTFYTVFKSEVGITPSKFQKQALSNS